MATNQKIGVSLAFSADTSKVKTQLQELQNQLGSLMNNSGKISLGGDFSKATAEIAMLKSQLDSATNSAGKLDLTKFNDSLKKSKMTINDYKNILVSLGPEGSQAFASLSQSIMNAEVPLKRTSQLTNQLWDNLKKTAGWQISSSMIHKFVGGIQKAYYYAQDLNESLNNIRVVTGQSTDQMAKFAKEANKAAQSLSTTTTAYTDAALIFYQQGLTGEAVTERTDTVIKLANVTGQSASEVSSYMTAIWNNFDDGSQSLEHYADVITALGASTASSSEEIAEGLEKFAAIGSTVGLSYEYATSALATVVAQTRQSADTVGTAFKTLFARIQDLEVGETLEDGTTLGKYAEALQAIGVNIKDSTGQVKEMDVILDEMGSKWQTIDKNTQIAVAQAVAGTRQYSQLVALMDNWETMQENLKTANNADGALQGQADIYAESWDAAKKRVQAALEDIYNKILNDEAFIKITNAVANIINGISKLIDNLGGLKGTLSLIGGILFRVFNTQIIQGVNNAIFSVKTFFGTTQKEIIQLRNNTKNALKEMYSEDTGNRFASIYQEIAKAQDIFLEKTKTMTDEQKKAAQYLMDQHNILVENAKKQAEIADAAQKAADKAQGKAERAAYKNAKSDDNKKNRIDEGAIDSISKKANQAGRLTTLIDDKFSSKFNAKDTSNISKAIDDIQKRLKPTAKGFADVKKEFSELYGGKAYQKVLNMKELLKKVNNTEDEKKKTKILEELKKEYYELEQVSEKLNDEVEKSGEYFGIEKYIDEIRNAGAEAEQADGKIEDLNNNIQNLENGLNKIPKSGLDAGTIFQELGSNLMAVSSAYNSLISAGDTLIEVFNGEASVGEAFSAVLTALIPLLYLINTLKKSETLATLASIAVSNSDTIAKIAEAIAVKFLAVAEGEAATMAMILNAALGLIIVAIMAIIAVVASVVIGFKIWEKSLQNTADASKRNADAQAEITKQLEEEANKVNELKSAYDDLYKQFEEGTLSYEDMKTKSYQLCMQYGEEGLALKALAGEYDSVAEAMAILEQKSQEKVAESAADEKLKYSTAVKDQFKASAKTRIDNVNGQETIDLKGMTWQNDAEKDLKQQLESAGIDFENNDHVNLNSFVKALEENGAQVQRILNQSNTDAAKQLREYISDASDSITALGEAATKETDARLKSIGAKYGSKDITSMNEYTQTIRKMAQEALDAGVYDSLKDAEEWANTYMAAIDKVANYAKSYTIGNSIFEDLEAQLNLDSVTKTVEELNNAISIVENSSNVDSIAKKNYALATNGGFSATIGGKEIMGYTDWWEAQEEILYRKTKQEDWDKGIQSEYINLETGKGVSQSGTYASDYFYQTQDYKAKYEAYLKEQKDTLEKNYSNAKNAVINTINSLKESDQLFFQQNSALLANSVKDMVNNGSSALEAVTKKWSGALSYAGAKAGAEYMASVIQGMNDEGRSLNTEEIEKLQSDYGLNNTNFSGMDQSSQMVALLEGYSAAEESIQKHIGDMQAAQTANLEAYRKMTLEDGRTYEQAAKDYENSTKEANKLMQKAAKEGKNNFSQEQLEELGKEINTNGTKKLSGDLKDLYNEIKSLGKGEDFNVDNMLKSLGFNKQYADEIEKLRKNIDSVANSSLNYTQKMKILNSAEESINKTLDTTQSAYKTLKQAASEYNSQGFMTMDTLQSLLALDPKYINCLIDEGGQFSLNRDSLIEYTKAQLLDYQIQQARDAQTQLSLALEGDKDAITKLSTASLLSEAGAGEDATESIMAQNEALINQIAIKVANNQLDPQVLKNARAYQESAKKTISAIGKTSASLETNFDLIMDGSSSASKASKKYFEDEFDRYWEFKKAIEAVEHAMSKLEEQQNNLYGQELIDNLNEVNKLLVQQKANYEALYEAQKVEAEELRESLSGYGAAFGEDGSLLNYADVTTSIFEQYGGSEDSEEYEDFKKKLERYDTLFYSEMVDTADKVSEATKRILENNLKVWETEIQVKLDTKQAERDWNDFLHDLNEDFKSSTKNLEIEADYKIKQINTYTGDDGTIATDISKIENINAEIDTLKNGGTSDLFSSLSEAENALKEANEKLREDSLALKDLYKDLWDNYLEGIDQVADGLEKINQQYEDLDESLEHQLRLTQLLYGDDAYDKMAKIYETQEKASLKQLDSLKQQKEYWYAEYQANVAAHGEDSEAAQKAYEKYRESVKALNEEEENYIQILQNKYNNAIDSIVETAKKRLSESKQEWDDTNKQNEGIYDDTERMYQLTSMQNKWNKLISDTTGLKNQQKLAAVMEEQMSYLKDKTELTEYDIGLAEKELEIAQAQIALEEAQNSKSTMKMTRGADGNWSYQYVADEDNVADKQQALLDKINDKYEYIKSANKKALEDIVTYEEEYWTRYGEIMKNTSLTQEEKDAKTAKLYETYYGENGILTHAYQQAALTESQLNKTTYEELTTLYETDKSNYENMTTAEKALIDAYKEGAIQDEKDILDYGKTCNDESLDYWQGTAKSMSDAWNADDGESIKCQVQDAMEAGKVALADYNEAVDAGCEAAGEDFKDVGKAVDDIDAAIDNLDGTTESYISKASEQLSGLRDSLAEVESAWKDIQSQVNSNIATMKSYETAANAATNASRAAVDAAKEVGGSGSGGNGGADASGQTKIEYESLGFSLYDFAGLADDGQFETREEAEEYYFGGSSPRYVEGGWNDYTVEEHIVEKVVPLKSGGYTGEWGDDSGKLAMLHQKELVLNADDTENILQTVSFVRDLASSIGSTLLNNLANIAANASGLAPAGVASMINEGNSSSNNIFNITAEFPNANNVDDIREAILSLPNLASQQMNVKTI